MQVKKNEIKEKILNTALDLFYQNGFEKTSMADIARAANISTGNVYRYFRDKEFLFFEMLPDEFIRSVESELKDLMALASREQDFSKKRGNGDYWKKLECLLGFTYQNRKRILILLNSDGRSPHILFRSKLEKMLVQQATAYFEVVYDSHRPAKTEKYILQLIYRSFIETCFQILMHSQSEEEWRLQLQVFRAYHLAGLQGLFKKISKDQRS